MKAVKGDFASAVKTNKNFARKIKEVLLPRFSSKFFIRSDYDLYLTDNKWRAKDEFYSYKDMAPKKETSKQ